MKSNLPLISIYHGLCFWCHIRSLPPSLRLPRFIPVFLSSRSFIVLSLRSVIHLELIFVKDVRFVSSLLFFIVFCIWLSICLSTIAFYLCQLTPFVWVSFWALLFLFHWSIWVLHCFSNTSSPLPLLGVEPRGIQPLNYIHSPFYFLFENRVSC